MMEKQLPDEGDETDSEDEVDVESMDQRSNFSLKLLDESRNYFPINPPNQQFIVHQTFVTQNIRPAGNFLTSFIFT